MNQLNGLDEIHACQPKGQGSQCKAASPNFVEISAGASSSAHELNNDLRAREPLNGFIFINGSQILVAE